MFGITETHPEDSTRGQQEENLGHASKMSPKEEKMLAFPTYDQPSVKRRKLNQKYYFPHKDNDNNGRKTKSRGVLLNQDKVDRDKLNRWTNLDHLKNCKTTRENSELNKSNSNIDIETDKIRYSIENVKLKELRVILKDIKHHTKLGMKTLKPENDVWEVERILAKEQREGTLVYLIKWKDWDSGYNTWEPVSNLVNCSHLLEKFEQSRHVLLDRFKKKVEFYPNSIDIEEYINQCKLNGETLEHFSVNAESVYASIQQFFKRKYIRHSQMENAIKRGILRMLIIESREKQQKSLKDWEFQMNAITKGKPLIRVENNVDLDHAPLDFHYIEDYLPGNGVIVPDDPPIGCECKICNSKTNCCFTQDSGLCPYTSTGKVRVALGTPIYECNKRCICDMNCINRVVQRGTDMQFCIFRTSNGRGWGVKTLQRIARGTFVTQYVGEVITNEEAERRGKQYDASGRTYLFDLDYNETEEQCPYTVDAAVYGNVSHFINHSCDPNLAVYGVWINCLDPNLPKLALFATRDIKKHEEITFDYTCQSSKNSDSMKQDTPIRKDLDIHITPDLQSEFNVHPDKAELDSQNNRTLCKCGADSCRRYLF